MVNEEKIRWVMKKSQCNFDQAQTILQSYNYNIDLLIESRTINSV